MKPDFREAVKLFLIMSFMVAFIMAAYIISYKLIGRT